MPRWSSPDQAAERRLLEGLNEGDEDAFAALYDVYAERLYDYSMSVACETKAATDIVHDAFIDAFRRAPRVRDRVRLRAWLYAAVRRRCLQRGRGRGLGWSGGPDWVAEVAEAAVRLSPGELREVLEASLARLDFSDQEALFLALRHGVVGSDLAAVLGIPARRASARVAKARTRAESAVAAEVRALARRCAAGRPPTRALQASDAEAELLGHAAVIYETGPAPRSETIDHRGLGTDPGDGAALAQHMATCEVCRRRSQISAVPLFGLAPAPVLPAALRHRIMHTATDPELAAHRADIAARGGNLTTEGLPRQPDVPSQLTRRWMFVGGGAAGALTTAVAAMLVMGPVTPDLHWPLLPHPHPSTGGKSPEATDGSHGQPPLGQGPAGDGQPGPGGPGASDRPNPPGPHFTPGSPVLPAPGGDGTPSDKPKSDPTVTTPAGVLSVGPSSVTLNARRQGVILLVASKGPVTWQAAPSIADLTLSDRSGTLTAGGSTEVAVALAARRAVTLPGEATVTFSDRGGNRHTVKVNWGLRLF